MTENFWQNQKAQSAEPAANEMLNLPTLVGNDIQNMGVVRSYSGNSAEANIYRATSSAVGEVLAQGNGGLNQGSGFFVNATGTMVTDLHVVYGQNGAINVKLTDGEVLPAQVVATDPSKDLALLQVIPSQPGEMFPSIKLGNSNTISNTDGFMEIGYPNDVMHISTGGLDGVEQLWTYHSRETVPGDDPNRTMLQTSTPTHTGESGGPLLNTRGEAVGVIDLAGMVNDPFGVSTPVEAVKNLLNAHGISYNGAPQQYLAPLEQSPGPAAGQPLRWLGEPMIPNAPPPAIISNMIMGDARPYYGNTAVAQPQWGAVQQNPPGAPSLRDVAPDVNAFKFVLGIQE